MSFNITFETSINVIKNYYPNDFKTLDWNAISSFKSLSENFIHEFSDNVNWSIICTFQKLSENFINNHSDKINYKILKTTHMSYLTFDFIFENKIKLNMENIKQNKKFYKKRNIISYFYKQNRNEFHTVYYKYNFADDTNIFLVNKLLTKKIKQSVIKTQDNEFYNQKYIDDIQKYITLKKIHNDGKKIIKKQKL